jgi:hypothetical protein
MGNLYSIQTEILKVVGSLGRQISRIEDNIKIVVA